MSESGVRPVTLRELVEMGFDLETFLDVPLGYSQSNGTIELREAIAEGYPGATPIHIEVTNGTSEANYLLALSLLGRETGWLSRRRITCSFGEFLAASGLRSGFSLRRELEWEPDWDEFETAVDERTRLVYVSNPNNPTGSILSQAAMRRIVDRCERAGAYLIADEVYLGAEIYRERTRSFWGMGDRVIVTSGLSKAYGIPGVRIGWIVGPKNIVDDCWGQHDYLTIGPNKLSDRIAQTAVTHKNREKCYARTRTILQQNLPIAGEWGRLHDFLQWREPEAGAIAFLAYVGRTERRPRGAHPDAPQHAHRSRFAPRNGRAHSRLGGKEEFLREGLRRVGAELGSLAAGA